MQYCAATGVYIGDEGSYSEIKHSNIIQNGYGNGVTIPSGHSGVYVENAKAIIQDCLLGSNGLTGLSVVREGLVTLRDCNIVSNNYTYQITFDNDHNQGSLRGNDLFSLNGFSIVEEFASNKIEP